MNRDNEEVATPLLIDVHLNYQGVANLTQTTFSQYYNGSEIVVAGQITDNSLESFTTEVIALSKSNKVVYHNNVPTDELNSDRPENENLIKRLWAFLTVKQLLEKEVLLKGLEKDNAKKEALDLSLKYKFVTPLTSMVVTKPQDEEMQVAHKPKEGEQRQTNRRQSRLKSRPSYSYSSLSYRPFGPSGGPSASFFHASSVRHPTVNLTPIRKEKKKNRKSSSLTVFKDDVRARLPSTTQKPVTTSPSLKSIRILKSSGNAKPLCYDVPLAQKLRLLQNDLSEFSMNGQLETIGGKGFSQIAIRYKTHQHLLLSTSEISYFDGQDTVKFSWDQGVTHHETEHVSLILRSNEMDITMGNIRVVILLHKKDEVFLWPAVWQQPKDAGLKGILGEADISYEEIPGSQTPTLKLKDKEVKTSWVMVRDYRLSFAPVVGCWLVPFQVVAQQELSDFTVTQL